MREYANLDWSITNIALTTFIISLGSLLQAVTGLGAGLIIVPMLAFISYSLVPGPMIFASTALSLMMAVRGRRNIDYTNMGKILAGLVVGTVVAAVFIADMPVVQLGVVFGVFILAAVLVSVYAVRLTFGNKSLIGAGVLSGFMGTAAGVGAPVLALLYQHHSGETLRASLALLYFITSLVMLLCLNVAGRFGESEFISGLYLMPGFLVGYVLSPKLIKWIDKGYARPAVLLLSTASAVLLIYKGAQ